MLHFQGRHRVKSLGLTRLTSICRALLLSTISLLFSGAVLADPWVHSNRHFNRHLYFATGLGVSHLNPDTSEVPESVNDRVHSAAQVTLGFDVTRTYSLEIHAADLGSAGLYPSGRIGYQTAGVSALAYMGRSRRNHARKGTTAYARVGFGVLNNRPLGDVRYLQENSHHLLFGAGLEYTTRRGIGVRAELFSFDDDVFYSQLALVFRFGKRATPWIAVKDVTPWVAIDASTSTTSKPIANTSASPDIDNDGVPNEVDACPETSDYISVDQQGCAIFAGVAEGVNFQTNSSILLPSAKATLDDVANTLKRHPTVNARISAHTDDWGDYDYNISLSEKRARSVVRYLVATGIAADRLQSRAYGESQPIANNRTAAGREQNRRVEIESVKGDTGALLP